jgi:hypothetical protein
MKISMCALSGLDFGMRDDEKSLQDESHYVSPLPSPSEPAQQPVPEYHDAAARAPASAAAQGNEGDFRSSADAIIGPAPTGVNSYAFLLLDHARNESHSRFAACI